MNKDILFKREDYVFSYRVAGILVKEDKVLLQRPLNTREYAFPGGHVELGETNAETLVREFKEEIDVDIKVGDLMGIGELFFPWDNKKCHQICLFYNVSLIDETHISIGDKERLDEFKISFEWITVANINEIMLYPPQAKTFLTNKINQLQHFIYYEPLLRIEMTTTNDLENIRMLWNNGEVMNYVGFPNGLNISQEKMQEWFIWVMANPNKRCHYSIYTDEVGYCGETFYNVNNNGYVSIDIKLFKKARGRGIAFQALSYVIKHAFNNKEANIIWVDPNPNNIAAIKLYKRMGFVERKMPLFLREAELDNIDFTPVYMEIKREDWFR